MDIPKNIAQRSSRSCTGGDVVQIVEPGQSAQFLVVRRRISWLYSPDGLQLVGMFAMEDSQWGARLALVLSQFANADSGLDNPSARSVDA
ncbi:MAG: hypothetical protein U0231_01210 [Nitrospiraceae bacterium]